MDQQATPPKTPKQLAAERSARLRAVIGRALDQLRGFNADVHLGRMAELAGLVEEAVATVAPDYKPPARSAKSRIFVVGGVYEVREKERARYGSIVGSGEADACVYERDVEGDPGTAVCLFGSNVRTGVKKAHLGRQIG